MLEYYFRKTSRLGDLRSGLLGEHIDGLAERLHCRGYTVASGKTILRTVGRFSLFCEEIGLLKIGQIDQAVVERFVETSGARSPKTTRSMVGHILVYLSDAGLLKLQSTESLKPGEVQLLERYDTYLRDVRGLVPQTRVDRLRDARQLVTWLANRPSRSLGELSGVDVLEFIIESADAGLRPATLQKLCSCIRCFLRYLRWEGIIAIDLARVVPKTHRWRLSSIPRHLPWKEVRALLDSIDVTHRNGRRDRAVLLLIARLGLRNGDVCGLELSDMNWRGGQILLRSTKTRKQRLLPLPREVGVAIADYLLEERPGTLFAQIFLCHQAPQSPLSTGTVWAIVDKHLRRAGIEAPSRGGNLLRHSLATQMVNAAVPIKEIADVLGHASIDTTSIYTKVDLGSLARVALPFPKGGAA